MQGMASLVKEFVPSQRICHPLHLIYQATNYLSLAIIT